MEKTTKTTETTETTVSAPKATSKKQISILLFKTLWLLRSGGYAAHLTAEDVEFVKNEYKSLTGAELPNCTTCKNAEIMDALHRAELILGEEKFWEKYPAYVHNGEVPNWLLV